MHHLPPPPRPTAALQRAFLLLAALLAAGVAPARADAPEARVASLDFEGVGAIPRDVLETKLLTRGPSWWGLAFWRPDPPFDAADLEQDLERIAEIYREYGYFEANARSELAWDDDRESVAITLVVEEGEPVELVRLAVDFVPGAELSERRRDEVRAAVPLAVGDVFGSRAYSRARKALLDALAERGHPAAALEGGARVDVDARAAFVEWTLDPGPLVRFGEIRLKGLEQVDERLVRRELAVETGAVYSLSEQLESERRIRDTELFYSVAMQPRPEQADTLDAEDEVRWPLEVRLRERPPRSLRVAIGYGTEEQLRGQVAWRHRNFLGGGRKLELRASYSSLLAGGALHFLQPHFLDSETDLGLEASGARETTPAFEAFRTEERLQLTRDLEGPWQVRGGYLFEYADVTDTSADAEEDEEASRVSALFAGLRRETLDSRLAPTRGTWLDLYAEPSLQAIGSSASYTTFVAEARAFHSWWRLVLGGRVRLGSIEPMAGSGSDDVPIFDRFFSGGSTSVRGYDYQSLGPRDGDDPLGGLGLAEASLEVRAPLPWWGLSLVGFVDAGQLSREPWTFRGRDVQFGAGPGIRLSTPVGPLRFDLGLPLNPREGDEAYRIHFAVGHAF